MNINLKIIIVLFLILTNPINSFSNEGVIKAEKWLNDITSMTADFIQVSSDGGSAEGKIFIKKKSWI